MGALYFGMGVLLIIILLYVIPGIGYIVGRYKVRKQVIAEHGAINCKILKKELKKNKYCTLFIGMNICLLMIIGVAISCIFLTMYIFFVFWEDAFTALFESFSTWYNSVGDFFGFETEMVTYVNESRYIYPRDSGNRVKEIPVLGYCLVNFRTSSGELLTLSMNSDYLAEVRTYENTEITYIPRTDIYVH